MEITPTEGHEWATWSYDVPTIPASIHLEEENVHDLLAWLAEPLKLAASDEDIQRWCLIAALLMRDASDS